MVVFVVGTVVVDLVIDQIVVVRIVVGGTVGVLIAYVIVVLIGEPGHLGRIDQSGGRSRRQYR